MAKKKRNQNQLAKQTPPPVQTLARQVTQYETRITTGPLPTPEVLAGYAQVDPSLVPTIVRMAETEQAHRHEQDRVVTRGAERWMFRGQQYAVFLGTAALGVAAYAVAHSQPWVAGTAITSIVGLVGAFIWKDRERDDKSAN